MTRWKDATHGLLDMMIAVRNMDEGPDPVELLRITGHNYVHDQKVVREMIKYCEKKRGD